MIERLRARQEWAFFGVLPKADPRLAVAWWTLLVVGGALPAIFAVVTGYAVDVVGRGRSPVAALTLVTLTFVAMQVVNPVLQAVSMNLGHRVSAWLNDELARACVQPPGIGHLEDPQLADDLVTAREFDRGMNGPPMFLNLDFVATGLIGLVGGLASAVVLAGYAWWAPLLLVGAWGSTHWLLRESGVWKDRNTDEVRLARRHADYAYRLAVDPHPAKEVRLFGLAGWAVDRFIRRRTRLWELQYRATRLREKSVLLCLLLVAVANGVTFAALGVAAAQGRLPLDRAVVFTQVAIGVSLVAFGGFNWALDGAAAPVAAVLRLRTAMAPRGALGAPPSDLRLADPSITDMRPTETSLTDRSFTGPVRDRPGVRVAAVELVLDRVGFGYPGQDRPIFTDLDLVVPAGSSLAVVGRNGAGKTTLAKLLCRLYDPDRGAVLADGVDLRSLEPVEWRRWVTAVFQDFVRFELTLRENVDPTGTASDEDVRFALADAGADRFGGGPAPADLDTILSTGYPGGRDLSGGQWQRVALARALCAVRSGAGLVLLDEPTAQLDVRGEAEVFERVLAATRGVTTIIVSHRFSTVRHADRICVLEGGRVVELGTHDELIALGGRYRTMFELQAQRFAAEADEDGRVFDVLG